MDIFIIYVYIISGEAGKKIFGKVRFVALPL
jgi:hypothetical protein